MSSGFGLGYLSRLWPLLLWALVGGHNGQVANGGEPRAGPAQPSREDLVSILERFEGGTGRLRVQYALLYGSVGGEDVGSSPLIPEHPACVVRAEYAVDFVGQAMVAYLDESETIGEIVRETVSATDGRMGTVLTRQPGQTPELSALIVPGVPDTLRQAIAHHPRPTEVAYWPASGAPLSKLLREASDVSIEAATVADVSCHMVTMVVWEDKTAVVAGKIVRGREPRHFRLWLDPARGMLPLRMEERLPPLPGKAAPRRLLSARYQTDVREVAPGVWFPFRSRTLSYLAGKAPRVADMTLVGIEVDPSAVVPKRVDIPVGAYVTDLVVGTKYRVGPTDEEARQFIEKAVDSVQHGSLKRESTEGGAPVGNTSQGGAVP